MPQDSFELDFNCDCEVESTYETLGNLRTRMMRRLGYSAQAANPPPGMDELLTDFLQSAQKVLYQKNPSLRTERFYRWTMMPGFRYYGIRDNDSQTDFTDVLNSCSRRLDEYRVTGVWIEDLNGTWLQLEKGIDPVYYTTATQNGLPSVYEIRSCIEVFPAPDVAYKLWVRGHFGLEPFADTNDRATIDDELVFLLALGNAKSHYGQRDARVVLDQAGQYLLEVKAGKHLTARYIPQTRPAPNRTRPRMLEFQDP